MKVSLAALFAITLILVDLTVAYPIIHATALNCRSRPSASATLVKTYPADADIKISCQTEGQSMEGSPIWDKTQDGCYVADYYVKLFLNWKYIAFDTKTGANDYVTGTCGSSGGSSGSNGSIPGPVIDDYLYKGQCGPLDPWRYYKCQCTSFVAQRVNKRLGLSFNYSYKGCTFGNANTWYSAAKSCGVTVNSTPVPGSVAVYNGGTYGHVAWVSSVSGDTVHVEEYNFNNPEDYGTRAVSKSSFTGFIHFKV
ncbi:hypothetical protein NQZ79_g3880 [Umbelopsis isabellina]|nr:hypothetical protein NQZ79_g3880 [Umbelopsis isabellina]